MKIDNYIAYWRNERKLTQEKLAKIIGIDRNTIARLERGESEGYASTWEKISKELNVSIEELKFGPLSNNKKIININDYIINKPPTLDDIIAPPLNDNIPLLTTIPAGPWYGWVDSYPAGFSDELIERCRLIGEHIFAIRVKGDSMEPELHEGDVLVIDPEIAFHANRQGKIGVVKHDESYKIRLVHLSPDNNNFILEPMNRAYSTEVIPVTGTTVYKIIDRRPVLPGHLY